MAIRLRQINGQWIALCAARSVAKDGDVYLDDGQDAALRLKFKLDYNQEGDYGLPIGDYDNRAIQMIEQEESNNPNRDWWDTMYKQVSDNTINYPILNNDTLHVLIEIIFQLKSYTHKKSEPVDNRNIIETLKMGNFIQEEYPESNWVIYTATSYGINYLRFLLDKQDLNET